MEESVVSEPRRENGKSNKSKPGSIPQESSPHDFREQIEAVYRLVGRYVGQTLEEFQMGLMGDSCPEDEVDIWCRIAATWYVYHDEILHGVRLPDDQEEKIVAALVAISAGEDDMQSLPIAAEVGTQLLAYYLQPTP
jgi:hypothetical protein